MTVQGIDEGRRLPLFVRLRNARRQTGLTQKELAQRIGVSRRQVLRWESGRAVPGPEIAKRLAEELGISPEGIDQPRRLPLIDEDDDLDLCQRKIRALTQRLARLEREVAEMWARQDVEETG